MNRLCRGIVLASLALLACAKKVAPSASAEGGDAGPLPARATVDAGGPKRPVTTSASIALGNLTASIDDRRRRDDKDPAQRLALVELLLARGQYLAKIADYEEADALASKTPPATWHAHLARALVSGAFHRFEAEAKALDEAERLVAPRERIAQARANVLMATGRYDEASKLAPQAVTPLEIATAAVLAARQQEHDESERLFELARTRYNDVSPFPLAWMDFQRATILEAKGDEARARSYYAEACDALPQYAHAAVHLAAAEPAAQAITRLEALRETSDDADVLAALADAHKRAGHAEDQKRLVSEARARFDELVAKHPEAFGDHAARFYLGAGGDAKKALELAKQNAKLRPTEEAIDLWMAAAAGASSQADVCASASAMKATAHLSAKSRTLADAASTRCSDAGAR